MLLEGPVHSRFEGFHLFLEAFGDFIKADKIVYIDNDPTEILEIYRDGKKFSIAASGNKFDGGFFTFPELDLEKKLKLKERKS
jgi:hypothetical protein